MMNRVRLQQNAFDRWIVIDAMDESKASSGSRFVPISEDGFPTRTKSETLCSILWCYGRAGAAAGLVAGRVM